MQLSCVLEKKKYRCPMLQDFFSPLIIQWNLRHTSWFRLTMWHKMIYMLKMLTNIEIHKVSCKAASPCLKKEGFAHESLTFYHVSAFCKSYNGSSIIIAILLKRNASLDPSLPRWICCAKVQEDDHNWSLHPLVIALSKTDHVRHTCEDIATMMNYK
jgi:hypothetical protein